MAENLCTAKHEPLAARIANDTAERVRRGIFPSNADAPDAETRAKDCRRKFSVKPPQQWRHDLLSARFACRIRTSRVIEIDLCLLKRCKRLLSQMLQLHRLLTGA
jgi:hypothetical protein